MSDLVKEESPLIAYQHCSTGKIRSIQPLPTVHVSGDVEVVVSVEQNETASRLMVWRFQSSAILSRAKLCSTTYSSSSYSRGGTLKRENGPLLSDEINSDLPYPGYKSRIDSRRSDDSDENEDDTVFGEPLQLSDELIPNGDNNESEIDTESQERFNL